ncbi:unnamed protein product [Clavelina lepadiformis]
MDSRTDEQLRGITMKSSAISLHYMQGDGSEYLVNLIDSPGHVDFSSEVCTAVRLCDGAIVLVDVVEGVCPQTQAVLRQAWLEKLTPVLVLNKIDRLITELKYTPLEAHLHLQQILEQVNAVTGSLFSAEIMGRKAQESDSKENHSDSGTTNFYDWSSGLEETDDSNLYFSPDQGNVVFASATDGWGFQIRHFAKLFADKLGIREAVLRKTLWGDYYVDTKAKKVIKGAQTKAKKSLFVQCILENIWAVYDAVMRRDEQKSNKIIKSLNLKMSTRDSRMARSEPKAYLHAVCSQWLPLSTAVLASVCEHLPSPADISEERVEGLMCGTTKSFASLPLKSQALKQDFLQCDPKSPSTIVLISKMVAVKTENLPQFKRRPLTAEQIQARREAARLRCLQIREQNEKQDGDNIGTDCSSSMDEREVKPPADSTSGSFAAFEEPEKLENAPSNLEKDQQFIAFARIFSGTLHVGEKLFVLGPKHDPSTIFESEDEVDIKAKIASSSHITEASVKNLYVWMGKELEIVDEAPAGVIIGIAGLDDHVLNSATLCSSVACPPFNALSTDTSPIIRVAVDPKYLSEMEKLMEGLRLLNQADPCVQVLVQDTGEHVVVAAGEVHLQRCLDDLRQRFAKIELNASEPIVPFRETVTRRPKVDMRNELIGTQEKDMVAKWTNKDKVDSAGDEATQANGKKINASQRGVVLLHTPNKASSLTIRAVPLPAEVVKLLENNSELIRVVTQMENFVKDLLQQRKRLESTCSSTGVEAEEDRCENEEVAVEEDIGDNFVTRITSELKVTKTVLENLQKLKEDLKQAFEKDGHRKWSEAIDHIWAFGPRGNGPNILLNRVPEYNRPSVWTCIDSHDSTSTSSDIVGAYREFDHSIVSGFQLATLSGPLCEEPLYGVCFIVEEWNYASGNGNTITNAAEDGTSGEENSRNASHFTDDTQRKVGEKYVKFSDNVLTEHSENNIKLGRQLYGPLSGQLISTCKEACRRAFQAQPQRLMAAMYTCNIQATAEVLGKVYAVLGRREGRVLSEDLKDGSDTFIIEATLPVAESFGFADEIRKRTSGLASPQLVFSHWEIVASDPFWVPTTEEEFQHFGEKADFENQAAKYMNSVRRRKGLFVEEKTVEHAEKQRTLSKNK